MPVWTNQSAMNRGELDPRLAGRTDIQSYYNGLALAENVVSIPQGGVSRRNGQIYLGTALGNGRIKRFEFNVDVEYLLVFTDLNMQVYRNDVLQTNLNGSGDDFIATPWLESQLDDIDFIQSADTGIVTHESHAPRRIIRTSDTEWSIDDVPLTNIPQFDFSDASSPTPTTCIQRVHFGGLVAGDRYQLSLEGVLTGEIIYNASTTANAGLIETEMLDLVNTPNTGITCVYGGLNSSGNPFYDITLAGDAADDWDIMGAFVVSSNDLEAGMVVFRPQRGTSSAENVWSDARGWPRTCTFHEGRLYFGGSELRPATLWGSNVNDFFNFDSGRVRDDEGIDTTLDTDQINAIRSIFSNRRLQIFTSGAEFVMNDSPILPTSAVSPQTNLGSRRVRPVSIDGVTLYAQRTGRAINQFVYTDATQASESSPVSAIAPHLIKEPKDLVVIQGSVRSDANYVFILNGDGSLVAFNTLASENVNGFTRWDSGIVKSIAQIGDRLHLLMERDGQYFIERESENVLTDSAVYYDSEESIIDGLDHLEGEEVDVKMDGAYAGKMTVSGGQVTLPRLATIREAGLSYMPMIKTMPLNIDLGSGSNLSTKKRIVRASLKMHESNGVLINSERIPDRIIGINQFDAPQPFTGTRRISLLGWSIEAQITITQDTPMPLTVLSIGVEVST